MFILVDLNRRLTRNRFVGAIKLKRQSAGAAELVSSGTLKKEIPLSMVMVARLNVRIEKNIIDLWR